MNWNHQAFSWYKFNNHSFCLTLMFIRFYTLGWLMQVLEVILKDGRTLKSTLVVVGVNAKRVLESVQGFGGGEKVALRFIFVDQYIMNAQPSLDDART